MPLREVIENYVSCDEQEEKDKEQMLMFIDNFDDVLTRNNVVGHFSASAFIVNKERTKMASVYHIISDGWTYPGGHADGEEDLLAVALREAEEETGLKPKVLYKEPFLISSNPVKSHIKRGKFVSAHIHYDLLYLMEADDSIPLKYREDESKGVKWISFDDIENENMVDFVKPIVLKLSKKVKSMKL
jgi:8-oxo-dGTP pyrophosphatase MutT (NUDIX family)